MKRQNLREREAAMVLDQLSGKSSIKRIRDHLKKNGFIKIDDDAIEQLELDQARRFVRSTRNYLDSTGNVSLQFFSFSETLEDGTKADYYRKFSELTQEEGAQLITDCHKRCKYWNDKMRRLYSPLRQRYGKGFEDLLPFALPEMEPKKVHAKKKRAVATPSVN